MRVCVIGAGLGGLAAAHALVGAGHDVEVRDPAARAGGVIASSRAEGFLREHAASSFLGGVTGGMLALCRELGVEVVTASPAARRRWIYIDGARQALPGDPIAFVRSELLSARGKLALLAEPARPRGDGGDESVYAFAERRFGAEAARKVVAPFVTGVFAADARDISLRAGFPKLAALDDAGGIVRGMIASMMRGRRAPAASRAPREDRGMWAPRAGVGAVTDALATRLGARVKLARAVRRVGRGGVVDGDRFDAVVLAVPAQLARELVADAPELAAALAPFRRAPAVQVYLAFADRADRARVADGFGVLIARGEGARTLGAVFESTVWPERAPSDTALVRCILAGAHDPGAFALADHELIAHARADLARVLGVASAPVHASVVRWPHGIAQYAVGHRERVHAAEAAARAQRIVLAGADYRGPGVNDLCQDAAVIAAELARW